MMTKRQIAASARIAMGKLCKANPESQDVKAGLTIAAAAHFFGFELEAKDRQMLEKALHDGNLHALAEALDAPHGEILLETIVDEETPMRRKPMGQFDETIVGQETPTRSKPMELFERFLGICQDVGRSCLSLLPR